jgi:tRNA uridine 5-carboxymethylaminomethyl modification enzyme
MVEQELERLANIWIRPDDQVQALLEEMGSTKLDNNSIPAITLLRRPEISYEHIEMLSPSPYDLHPAVKEQVEIQTKYAGYIEKQLIQVNRLKKMENKQIPLDIDYVAVYGLATEAKQRLEKVRPLNLGQASRISGVNPADISILLVYLEQYHKVKAARG